KNPAATARVISVTVIARAVVGISLNPATAATATAATKTGRMIVKSGIIVSLVRQTSPRFRRIVHQTNATATMTAAITASKAVTIASRERQASPRRRRTVQQTKAPATMTAAITASKAVTITHPQETGIPMRVATSGATGTATTAIMLGEINLPMLLQRLQRNPKRIHLKRSRMEMNVHPNALQVVAHALSSAVVDAVRRWKRIQRKPPNPSQMIQAQPTPAQLPSPQLLPLNQHLL